MLWLVFDYAGFVAEFALDPGDDDVDAVPEEDDGLHARVRQQNEE